MNSATVSTQLSLGIVVLNWNAREDSLACLARLVPQCAGGDTVVLVDNGSQDGSVDAVRARFASVRIVENGANLGFAGGVNAGLRTVLEARTDLVLVLNNDTEPPDDFLARLRETMARRGANVVQPLLVSAFDTTRIDSAGLGVRWLPGARDLNHGEPVSSLDGAGPRAVFGACGAALCCTTRMLREVGLFDEDLFVLFEDVELAFRIRAAGHEVVLVPDLRLPHRRGVSASRGARSTVARARRRFWLQRNIVALALRAWPWPRLLIGAPILALRAVWALWLQGAHGPRSCGPLWRRSLRMRAALRSGLRRHRVDRWLGVRAPLACDADALRHAVGEASQ